MGAEAYLALGILLLFIIAAIWALSQPQPTPQTYYVSAKVFPLHYLYALGNGGTVLYPDNQSNGTACASYGVYWQNAFNYTTQSQQAVNTLMNASEVLAYSNKIILLDQK